MNETNPLTYALTVVCKYALKHTKDILEIIRVFYLPIDAQENCSKRILKFILKQLRHFSV
jgi:hypothetical protein